MPSLYQHYLEWPDKIARALERGAENCPQEGLGRGGDHVVVSGIGGSGAPGAFLEALTSYRGSPPFAWSLRRAELDPRHKILRPLVVGVSYSGTTAETISVARQAVREGLGLGVVSGKGPLAELASQHSRPLYTVPGGSLPRAELPWLLAGALKISECLGAPLASQRDLALWREKALAAAGEILAAAEALERALYSSLERGRRIVFASTWPYHPLIHRARAELSENAAAPSEPLEIPEMGHNQVASLRRGGSLVVVFIDPGRPEDLALRAYLQALSRASTGVEVFELSLPEDLDFLGKILHASMILGLATSGLGESLGVDPWSLPEIRLFREVTYRLYYSST